MFKIILFFILFCYAIYRIGGFVIKLLMFGTNNPKSRVHKNGNVHVDKKPTQDKSFGGGEYVDYEEVK